MLIEDIKDAIDKFHNFYNVPKGKPVKIKKPFPMPSNPSLKSPILQKEVTKPLIDISKREAHSNL